MIYFIKSETLGLIKIGYCREGRLISRYNGLRTSSPDKLTILGFIRDKDINCERELHYQFNYLRVRGEWFSRIAEIRKRSLLCYQLT